MGCSICDCFCFLGCSVCSCCCICCSNFFFLLLLLLCCPSAGVKLWWPGCCAPPARAPCSLGCFGGLHSSRVCSGPPRQRFKNSPHCPCCPLPRRSD
jgi:hypothetical protein